MLTLIHNPRCSKSREALSLLEEHKVPFQVIRYLETPLSAKDLVELLKRLNVSARSVLRQREEEYQTLGLDNPGLSESDLINAIAAHPRLLERPILDNGTRAVIGRPTENLLELLK